MLGMSAYPHGRIDLQVTLREGENSSSEFLTFEVEDFDSAYNCILGRPFLEKFMAVPILPTWYSKYPALVV